MYIPEDVEEQSEYDLYLQKLRVLALAGKVADNMRHLEAALEAAKVAANAIQPVEPVADALDPDAPAPGKKTVDEVLWCVCVPVCVRATICLLCARTCTHFFVFVVCMNASS